MIQKLVYPVGIFLSALSFAEVPRFHTMGSYSGTRTEMVSEETASVRLRTQKHDYTTRDVFTFLVSVDPINEDEAADVPHADKFLFEMKTSLAQYFSIVEGAELIQRLEIDHRGSDQIGRLYQVDAKTNDEGIRVIQITSMYYNGSNPTRKSELEVSLKDGRFVQLKLKKYGKKRRVFSHYWKKYLDIQSKDLGKEEDGLYLVDYGFVTDEDDLRSALDDSSPGNFRRLTTE